MKSKNEVKQLLITVSFNRVKDLILANKINEAQVIVETLNTQLKEVDTLFDEDMSFAVGDFVTLDDPKCRRTIDINNYEDMYYLNNIYEITELDKRYVYLRVVKSRESAPGMGMAITLQDPKETNRMTKLIIRNSSIASDLKGTH